MPPNPTHPADGYHGLIGLWTEPAADDPTLEAVLLTVGPQHLRSLGMLHGGVIAGLMDTLLGKAASTRAPAGHYTVTVQLNVNFIRPAGPGTVLRGSPRIAHDGRRSAVVLGELRDQDGALIATGSATCMHLPRPEPDLPA